MTLSVNESCGKLGNMSPVLVGTCTVPLKHKWFEGFFGGEGRRHRDTQSSPILHVYVFAEIDPTSHPDSSVATADGSVTVSCPRAPCSGSLFNFEGATAFMALDVVVSTGPQSETALTSEASDHHQGFEVQHYLRVESGPNSDRTCNNSSTLCRSRAVLCGNRAKLGWNRENVANCWPTRRHREHIVELVPNLAQQHGPTPA